MTSCSTASRCSERDGVAAVLPRAGRVPYEILVGPTETERDAWTSALLPTALQVLAELMRRLHAIAEGPVPLNAWLHTGKGWHIEFVPRLTVLAGLELGAGIYVNTVAPEEAAEQLREAARRARGASTAPERAAELAARGSAARRRSPRRGSGPCPSPA